MSVSKRTRFEVLRRDNFTCQYCGAKAPDVTLHVDHVEPVALGGSDKPDNLLAACKDCNMGKTSIVPGSPLVEAVGARAAAYALGMIDKMTRIRATIEEADEYCSEFEDLWNDRPRDDSSYDLPVDYESTIHRWFRMGAPIRMLDLAIKSAQALAWPKGYNGRFRYLCGIVWNQLDDDGIDYSLTEDTVKVWTEFEASERAVEGYEYGVKVGRGIARQHSDSDMAVA